MTQRLPILVFALALLAPAPGAFADETAPDASPSDPGAMTTGLARAQFTPAIADREPMGAIDQLSTDKDKVYFFTELRDMSGHTVTHRWSHQGQIMAEVSFEVRGPRWRVWSSKNLQPDMTGEWTVAVVDDNGQVLGEKSLKYGE